MDLDDNEPLTKDESMDTNQIQVLVDAANVVDLYLDVIPTVEKSPGQQMHLISINTANGRCTVDISLKLTSIAILFSPRVYQTMKQY